MRHRRDDWRRPYNDRNPIIDTTRPPNHKKRRDPYRSIAVALAAELMQEQGGKCYWCGVAMWHPAFPDPTSQDRPEDRATFDHKIPMSKGGPTTKKNGVAACKYCNNDRGDTPFEEYEQWVP